MVGHVEIEVKVHKWAHRVLLAWYNSSHGGTSTTDVLLPDIHNTSDTQDRSCGPKEQIGGNVNTGRFY